MRCILVVKQYGKTKYGSVTLEEYTKMIKESKFLERMLKFMENSFVMEGDYQDEYNLSPESEAFMFSGGTVQPMQWRFK